MPNWVYSKVAVTGDAADVARLKEQVGRTYTMKDVDVWEGGTTVKKDVEYDDVISFWNIVAPEGEDLEKYQGSLGTPGAMPFWYDWNCDNWGCKWDASDTDLTEIHGEHIEYTFSTPWSPPVPAMTSLAQQYPNLTLTMDWEEEQGFGGTLEFVKDDVTVLDEYDIPATHEEMMSRKEYCYCEDSDPEDMPFADCPGALPEPDPSMLIPHNELEIEALS